MIDVERSTSMKAAFRCVTARRAGGEVVKGHATVDRGVDTFRSHVVALSAWGPTSIEVVSSQSTHHARQQPLVSSVR